MHRYSARLIKYHKTLTFSFPSLSVLVFEVLILAVLLSLISVHAVGLIAPLAVYLSLLALAVTTLTVCLKPYITFRRALGYATISLFYALCLVAVCAIFWKEKVVYALCFSSAFALVLFALIMLSFSPKRSTLILVTLYGAGALLLMSSLSTNPIPQYYMAFGYIALILMLYALNRSGKKILGISGLTVLKSYLDTFLLNDPSSLEKILTEGATVKTIPTHVFKLSSKTSKRACIILIPHIHPGPFRNVGSSSLPQEMEKTIETELGLPAFVFHGPSTHSEDLVSQKEMKNYIASLIREIKKETFTRINVLSEICESICHNIRCYGLLADTLFVATVESTTGLEDLPYQLYQYCLKRFPNLVLIDAHNSLNPHGSNPLPYPDSKEGRCIAKCLEDILKKCKNKTAASNIYFNFSLNKHISDSLAKEIAEGGIKVLVLKIHSKTYAIILLDSNNVTISAREKIYNLIRTRFNVLPLIATTDTHVVVGLQARETYLAAGSTNPDVLASEIEKEIASALEKLEEAEIEYMKVECKVRVIGNFIQKISKFITFGVRIGLAYIITIYLLPLILLIAF